MNIEEIHFDGPDDLWKQVNGGEYPPDITMPSHRIVWPPDDGMGLVILPKRGDTSCHDQHNISTRRKSSRRIQTDNTHGTNGTHGTHGRHVDHFVTGYVSYDADDLKEMIDNEQKHIVRRTQYKRQGGASSYLLPHETCQTPKGLSAITLQNRQYKVTPSKASPALPTLYTAADGTTKKFYAYRNTYGRVLIDRGVRSKAMDSKHEEMRQVPGHGRVCVERMRSRLVYMGLLEKENLLDTNIAPCLEKFVQNHTRRSTRFRDFDVFLLNYSCHLQSYINHQTVAAHLDSQIHETMGLYSRSLRHTTGVSTPPRGSNGHTALLNYGAAAGMVANRSVVHASYSNVWHVADNTRNVANFTYVECPKD